MNLVLKFGKLDYIIRVRFCKVISKLEGQWLLTYQDSPIVREAFSGYDILSLERPNGIGNRGKVSRYREVIITKHHLTK